jgi:tetratricopeptide (TPR) repeat protein
VSVVRTLLNIAKAFKLSPNSDVAYYIGVLYSEKENWTNSKYYLQKAIELNPDYANAYVNRAELFSTMGLLEKDPIKRIEYEGKATRDKEKANELKKK